MPFCKNCGAENNAGSKFCFKCGSPLETPQAADINNAPQGDINNIPQGEPQADFNNIPQGQTQPDFNGVPQGQPQPDFNGVPQGQPQPDFNGVPQGQPQPDFNGVPQGQMNYGAPNGYAMPQGAPVPPVQPKEKKPVNKKLIIIIAVAVAVAIIAAVAAIIIVKNVKHKKEIERKTIDLKSYIEVEFDGYDTMGTAKVELNYDDFYAATLKAMGKTEKSASDRAKGKALDLYEEISLTVDKSSELSNGDTITIDADYDEDKVKEANVIIKFDSYEVEVEGLDSVKEVDIFDSVELKFSGLDGDASVDVKNTSKDSHVKDLWISASPSYNLSVGDEITLSIDEYYQTFYLENYGIKIKETTKEYTVTKDDVDTYITKIEDINDEMMATVKDNAVEEIKSSYSYSSNKLSNIEYAGAYLVYTKEDYKANTYNELYAVYTATITFNDKDLKPATIYLPVKMGSVINRSDGKQELNTSWFSLKGYSNVEDSWTSFYGYGDQKTMFEELISEVVGEYDGYTYEVSGDLEDYGSSDAKDDKKPEEETTTEDETEAESESETEEK